MSDRSGSPADEGSGDEIRPHGEHDSSEESEDDPEEYRRIAEGFIVEGEEDDDEDGEDGERRKETKEERRARKKEEKRNRKRQKRKERGAELSDDELELINENRGIAGGPSLSRPLKRLRRRSGSEGEDEDLGRQDLRNMFADDEERMDEDDDDLGDFIEEDEEAAPPGETEDERRQRKREEKKLRREQAKRRPDVAGVDKGSWDEIFEVFGSGEDYDWALQGEEGLQDPDEVDPAKKDLRLEDVFDPSEIKARRLQDEDKTIASLDRPERHQLMNSTLSDNPVLAPDSLYPPPDTAAGYAYNKISTRTQYIFCGMHFDGTYPPLYEQNQYNQSPPRRPDLAQYFLQAVSTALNMMFVQHLEVPYLWHYKRDVLSLLENEGRTAVQFLERDELWALYNLGIKFRAVYERTQQVRETWRKIQARRPDLEDRYLTETLLGSVCMLGIESAAEGVEWLAYHYAQDIREIKEEEAVEEGAKRLPERMAHDDLREGPIMTLVKAFGIDVSSVAVSFNDAEGVPRAPQDVDRAPADLAEEFAGTGTPYLTGEDALHAASTLIVNELAKDPSIRLQAREFVRECADVTVNPTERGMAVIDQYHTYYTFKFLTSKPANSFAGTPQWLHILQAEEEGLITISIDVAESQINGFSGALERCCVSTDYGEVASRWNELRKDLCRDLTKNQLIPMGSKWVKEYLRSQAEDFVAERCRQELEFRINVKPYCGPGMEPGETPSVLALTNGRGDIRDAVIAIMLDDNGVILTQTKFDNLKDDADREAFMDLVERRKPKVVAIGGLSVHTARLKEEVQGVLREIGIRLSGENAPVSDTFPSHEEFTQALAIFDERIRPFSTPLIIPNDATARMYMNSEEAAKEHPGLPLNGRYALALARFTQNPLNAYAKLGRRMLDITFMEYHQKLISQEKLLIHLERALVNSVCAMGIEINSCVADAYQRSMLPFIAGLGPRKADSLVHAVGRAGTILNRIQFSDSGLFGPTIFENVAGFLSIESDLDNLQLEEASPQDQADPLDCTRIHPEDYEFAQKMCQDALDLDVEDVEGQHKSEVVQKLMTDPDRSRKLSELNLDDFAYNLQRQGEGNKRHTLGEIVNELIQFRSDRRPPFYEPNPWEVVTMLTGETERSIGRGIRVSATVRKALQARAFCSLESGIDAILDREYAADDENVASCEDVVKPRQTLNAVVINVEPARFQVRISIRSVDLANSVPFVQPFVDDPMNSRDRRDQAEAAAAAKKRRQQGKAKRVINHPNWHVMNSGQAEQFLASQPRGEVVIRPSSKGGDHLALTFKLDETVFQHVDIEEFDKRDEYSLGQRLEIGKKYRFIDLDDVIVNYVKAIMRMLEEAERSEKFRPEDELESYLKNTLLAFPNRSMYGFCLSHDKPGYLNLLFLNKSTKDGGAIQTWPVKLLPGAYALNNAEVPGMTELCNAFKAQYSSKLMEQGAGGKTPGIRAGRTPAHGGRTPGGRTPGLGGATPYGAGMGRTPAAGGATPYGAGMSRTPVVGGATPYGPPGVGRTPIRPGMTPNAYGQAGPSRGPAPYGGATPSATQYSAPAPYSAPQAYGPPGGNYPNGPQGGMRPPMAPGMNPERAAMLARQGGR